MQTLLAKSRFDELLREGRHGTQVWANRAAFSEATDLFRFRAIPDIEITTKHIIVCEDGRFQIISVG